MGAKFFYVITGMSGAGKSLATRVLEDQGIHCVDNLPVPLIPQFVELTRHGQTEIDRIALVCDIRGGKQFAPLLNLLDELEREGVGHRLIFLEASDEALLRRFSETRRRHPIHGTGLRESIEVERKLVADLRGQADLVIDTSKMSAAEFRTEFPRVLESQKPAAGMNLILTSFGFKHGSPTEADLIFDVRFLPNPYYVEKLKPLTGLSSAVSEYVFSHEAAREFLNRLTRFLDYLIPQYVTEGKTNLTIGIGCTGGQHRSVAITERLAAHLGSQDWNLITNHRDAELSQK